MSEPQIRVQIAKKKVEEADKPMLGTAFYIVYTVMKALSFVFVSYLYNNNDYSGTDEEYLSLNPWQLLFGKSLVSVLTLLLWLNVSLKKNVYNGINRTNVGPLVYRTIQGSISNMINYSVAKFIPSSIISVVNSLSPIITVCLAYFLLKEIVKWFDIFICTLNFSAIVVTIVGADPSED